MSNYAFLTLHKYLVKNNCEISFSSVIAQAHRPCRRGESVLNQNEREDLPQIKLDDVMMNFFPLLTYFLLWEKQQCLKGKESKRFSKVTFE